MFTRIMQRLFSKLIMPLEAGFELILTRRSAIELFPFMPFFFPLGLEVGTAGSDMRLPVPVELLDLIKSAIFC